MGTRTVYVKNEALWEAAKSVAGQGGLSAFVEEALQRLVTAKQLEQQKRHERFSLPYRPMSEDSSVRIHERLEFEGKCLGDWGSFSVYQTKAGTFVVTYNSCDEEQSVYAYSTYDSLAELQKEEAIATLKKEQQDLFWDQMCDEVPIEARAIWID